MKLMIIESPGKRESLQKILGDDFQIVASNGHVRDLPQSEMGVEAPDFVPQYELTESGEKAVGRIAKLLPKASAVYLATDPDKEGEAISWHLQKALNLKSYIRVSWGEVTKQQVLPAMQQPRQINMQGVAGQEARRVIDRLAGYMVSPVLSGIAGVTMSAGRTQSVAVKLVVERERAIKAFARVSHFGASFSFSSEGARSWTAEWQTKPFLAPGEAHFMDEAFARAVTGIDTFTVTKASEGNAKRSPPGPFITSTLQQAASVKLGFDPQKTIALAQNLYDGGHITYHRSDNPNVSDSSLGDIYEVATALGIPMADEPRKFEAAEGAQVGHPGVTPTHWEVEVAGDTDEHRAVYRLIRLRAIASQLADARYATRSIELSGTEPISGKTITLAASGRVLIDAGWLALVDGDQTDEEETAEPESTMPLLEVGQVIDGGKGKLLAKVTKAPGRFTKASLLGKIDQMGIGRPATFANIVDGIFDRGYVTLQGRQVIPLPKGETVVDTLDGRICFMDYGFTKDMERTLDLIATGKASYKEVVTQFHERLQGEIAALKQAVKPRESCPRCNLPMRRIEGAKGFFWGCTGHPECTVSFPDNDGKAMRVEFSQHLCAKCGKPLVNKKKLSAPGVAGFNFWVCSGIADGCRMKYPDKNGAPAIPGK